MQCTYIKMVGLKEVNWNGNIQQQGGCHGLSRGFTHNWRQDVYWFMCVDILYVGL